MTITLRQLRARKERRRTTLHKALEKIKKQLVEMGALKIIVFGSYVSGNLRRWSDLDILVVMPSNKSGKEWFKEIYDRLDLDVEADILPYTEKELNIKMETSSFVRHAMRTGKVIYEKG